MKFPIKQFPSRPFPSRPFPSRPFPNKQRGISAIGWVFLVLIIGAGVSVVTKLIPHYMDFNTLSTIIEDLSQENGLVSRNTGDIEAMIKKRLKLNNIRDFDLKNKISVKRGDDRIVIDVNYEVREPLFKNLSFVVVFTEQVFLRD